MTIGAPPHRHQAVGSASAGHDEGVSVSHALSRSFRLNSCPAYAIVTIRIPAHDPMYAYVAMKHAAIRANSRRILSIAGIRNNSPKMWSESVPTVDSTPTHGPPSSRRTNQTAAAQTMAT